MKLPNGATVSFYQFDLITFIAQAEDGASCRRLADVCRAIRDYLNFTWGELVEEWLDSYSTRTSNSQTLIKRLGSLFTPEERDGDSTNDLTPLPIPWIQAERLQVSFDFRAYCSRLITLALIGGTDNSYSGVSSAPLLFPFVHHVLLTVGTKFLCIHSTTRAHNLHPDDLVMLRFRLAERIRSKTIANETENVYLRSSDGRLERYLLYMGRITPGVTAIILRYRDDTDAAPIPLALPSSGIAPQLILECSHLLTNLQQVSQGTNTDDEILVLSGLPPLDQLTEFLVCKDESHVTMLPYWTKFPGLVYFVTIDTLSGLSMVPVIDENLHCTSVNSVTRDRVMNLMFEWISRTKEMASITPHFNRYDCLMIRNQRFAFSFNRKTYDADGVVGDSISLIWSIWVADLPLEAIRRFASKLR